MGSSNNITPREVLEAFYSAERVFTATPEADRDFATIAATLSNDFKMEQSSALPWAGWYHGPKGLQKWIEAASRWVTIDVRDPEIFEREGSDRVVVLSRVHYTSQETGEEIDFPLSQTIAVDRDRGLITEIRSYYWDVERLNRFMGYSPPSQQV